jgi:chromosome segregation ATPase
MGNREVSEKKNQNKRLELEVIANLRAEVEILKNQLSSFSTEWASRRNTVNFRNQELLQKKQRLQAEEAKFHAFSLRLKNELNLADKFENAKANAEEAFREKEAERKKLEGQIALQKEVSVRSTQQLFKLREEEASLYGEIQGIMAACRNLQSHINKLNQEFQKQQELLYNAEYQIQLMERKVARAKGERTLEEKKDLQKDVEEAAKKNTDIKAQHKVLNESVKKLNDDLRAVENRLGEVKGAEKKLGSQIEELALENDMTVQDLSKVTKKKEEVLVQHDIMKLEIKKIRESLGKATDHVYGLENKKNQLEMSMQEREREILVHRDVLLAEQKAIEDERHRIAIELAERRNKVKNLRIKYESLVQKARNSPSIQTVPKTAKPSTPRPTTLSRPPRRGKNCNGKVTNSAAKSTRRRRS